MTEPLGTERNTFLIDDKGIVAKICWRVKAEGHAQISLSDLRAPQRLLSLE